MDSRKDNGIIFILVDPSFSKKRLKRFKNIGSFLLKAFPSIPSDLKKASLKYEAIPYMISVFFSSLLYGVLFSVISSQLVFLRTKEITQTIILFLQVFFGVALLFFIILTKYPKILAQKRADEIDKHLIFAVKDLLLHTATGAPLYNAIVNVSKSDYGEISDCFKEAILRINAGKSIDNAMEEVAKETDSEFFNKVSWQIVNTIRSGGNLKESLNSIINELTQNQRARISSYANELNLWSLIYMLFAVAIPTIGMTMMIILSSFADMGVNEITITAFVAITVIVQVIIINMIKARRPAVEF